ncbi:H-2 class II histocompatibility antigen, A-U alpha chain-like isoform X2 [Myripristis murdjan]|uniref:H-2 class II histocompatibility antigen, A-U alpha chain-like isoform X2 n=1 Tax=Myripristis murdjan TaxID=586833 RepID=UPI00117600DF|nr:H-2 class II histocompatibility antigen, A-U alpha chain-like isoform X2 [Myripristis murdjan]
MCSCISAGETRPLTSKHTAGRHSAELLPSRRSSSCFLNFPAESEVSAEPHTEMKSLLILSWLLCVRAEGLHEDISITGCSGSGGEAMDGLDAEQRWYADFVNKRWVDAMPKFADPVTCPGCYEQAVAGQAICQQNLATLIKAFDNPPVQLDAPRSTIYPRDDVQLHVENHLICHVSGFFPAPVSVYWTRNEQNVTEGTSINTPYPSKDGTFTQISTLKFTPQQGDIYSCTVQHPALEQPLTRVWEEEQDRPGIGPVVFCGLGLTVGLLGVVTGTFFCIAATKCS